MKDRNFETLAVLVVLMALVPCTVMAHPPADMKLSYDPGAGELTVTVTHDVDNPGSHFVYLVTIQKDGQVAEERVYSRQPASGTFTYRYPVSVDPGDTLAVTASCNQGGSISRRLAVPGTTAEAAQSAVQPSEIPLWYYHAVLAVLGLVFFLVAVGLIQWKRSVTGWYRYHKTIATIGGVLTIIAFLIPFFAIFLGGAPSYILAHAMVGIVIIFLVLLIIILGIARERGKKPNPSLRTAHIQAGRLLVVLMAANLVYGLVLMGVI
ncbi:MAG: hypothetical protein KC400_00415 [Methanolinea sp.]|nr:hypothetical protein [Methanolinea sp.]